MNVWIAFYIFGLVVLLTINIMARQYRKDAEKMFEEYEKEKEKWGNP